MGLRPWTHKFQNIRNSKIARGVAYFAGIGAGIWTEDTLPPIKLKDIVYPEEEKVDYLFTEYSYWKG